MGKIITVFGSSQPKPGEEEYETAYKLGRMLGEAGLSVCTGGYHGIMDAVSKGVVEAGQKALGVTVNSFKSVPSSYLTEEIVCDTLFERISRLVDIGDAYIVLKGGTGTLLELSVVWEYMNKNLLDRKPVACEGEMWEPLVKLIDERMLFENREQNLVSLFRTIENCAEYIINSV